MQRVSMQMIKEMEKKESVTVIKETVNVSGNVGLKTFAFLVKQLFELPRKARESGADVILFSSMVTASLSYLIDSRVSIPMVTINHGRDVTLPVTIYQWFVPRIFAHLDGVISVSRATREECIKRGMEPEQGVALPNGFDLDKLENFPDKQTSRTDLNRQFQIPFEGKFALLTVGRQVKRKGHEWFIRNVLPRIESKVVYMVVGDGPEFENVKRAVADSGQQDKVFLLGRQPDEILKEAYSASDLFVMPNIPVEGDMEGFGIVLLEANMARTPAVAADLEGIKDVITNGENGYRIPALEPELFAQKVDEVLRGDLTVFSENTRNFVKKKFSWQTVTEEYLNYLEKVIDEQ
ncbi:glycosyltransferase family 4 protein [Balneolaceae bacterium YR4-1]|uniref:Glycosyltransferase family 4 protein n=2 Tax=Halalkalibaculum roseum TaxID=2709311 RepID=A0A6M1SVX1_9BACT|nr:glycosyltransferase family 4 protein [Halalkalibaculum roseum]